MDSAGPRRPFSTKVGSGIRTGSSARLAHVEGNKIRAAYNAAQYLEQRRRMMEWWSDHLDAQKDISELLG